MTVRKLDEHVSWRRGDMLDASTWTVNLAEADHRELDDALQHAKSVSSDVLELGRDDFPLSNLKQKLAEIADSFPDLIEGVRGDGLMQGLKCKESNLDVVGACRSKFLLTVPAGDNVVRLLPPLTVSQDEIQEAVEKVEAALTDLQKAG